MSSAAGAAEEYRHYTMDVRAAAQSAFAADAPESEVLRSVGRVAERHAVSDWEAQPSTYFAIGEALKQVGKDEQAVRALLPQLAGENPDAQKMLLQGYRS